MCGEGQRSSRHLDKADAVPFGVQRRETPQIARRHPPGPSRSFRSRSRPSLAHQVFPHRLGVIGGNRRSPPACLAAAGPLGAEIIKTCFEAYGRQCLRRVSLRTSRMQPRVSPRSARRTRVTAARLVSKSAREDSQNLAAADAYRIGARCARTRTMQGSPRRIDSSLLPQDSGDDRDFILRMSSRRWRRRCSKPWSVGL